VTVSERIKQEARALGFAAVGIARIESADERSDSFARLLETRLRDWLARGYHGVMAWMDRDPDRRADPRRLLPGCRSLISLGLNYYTGDRADERPGHGRIARYAWGEDYHRVLRRRLEQLASRIKQLRPEAETRCYVDTGPVMEKAWAQEAGLGWIGKHSNLVSPSHGSWLLLGEILTTLDLTPDEPGTDLCGTCTLCIQACPTGAIAAPYVVDARRCISYLTIELRGRDHVIPDELARRMGNRIFGCDDCLDVCPYNVNAASTAEPAFQPRPMTLSPELRTIAAMNDEEFEAAFRGSPIRRPKQAGMLRNARLALENLARSPVSFP
jgi:epoxyqueuosine reductase